MNFGKRTPEDESRRIVDRAIEAGFALFDTANVYNDGASERILGKALGKRRKDVLIATKVGMKRRDGKVEGLSPAAIHLAVDESLKTLGTDVIDLYYLHVPDHTVPEAESMDAMLELIASGKIRAWGVSNYASWQILEMMIRSDAKGAPRPLVAQQLYNPLLRELDIEYFAFAAAYGLHTSVYNPLAGGLLTEKTLAASAVRPGSRFDKNPMYQKRYLTPAMRNHAEGLAAIAKAKDLSLVDLAYAFVATTPGVDSVLLGPASVAQLDAGIAGCNKPLDTETRREMNALFDASRGSDAHYVR
jgi:aryl-alcohol dehydrogenase-like predicted oxidoreductase